MWHLREGEPSGESRAGERTMFEMLISFEGRINRKPYWLFMLAVIMGVAITTGIDMSSAEDARMAYAILLRKERGLVSTIYFALTFWPGFVMQVKRWHDINKSGWWILINLIPIIGSTWALLETGFQPGTRGRNRFGEDPLEQKPASRDEGSIRGFPGVEPLRNPNLRSRRGR
jgi:uncharacterized membrane protein YhaH (DUF805 family)